MTTKTATFTHAGHTFTATVLDGRVTVSQDGVWAGEGRYTSHGIEDCPAVLGDDEEASEEIYRLLDAALAATDEWLVGRWVYVMAGDDSDYGVIRRIDGDRAEVAWSTEVVTWIDRSELVLAADRAEAEAAVEAAG